ncbi:SIR2 family NAD-dependent protein deacylase [Photobacterium leiognathi]|uniref:SIR2 family NAD-dependent protein deacylase n=1 Tax=Photobacterium leiognathi TaxID=553611 RepID=UPI002981642A|nr:SIR2 family protein [Photobacterium leiognathi]
MDHFYELSFALESNSLCFFVGTGFSMHVTDGNAPNWLSLLKDATSGVEGGNELIEQLFPDNKPIMSLEECASVIQAKMHTQDKCLHAEIAKIINGLKITDNKLKAFDFIRKHTNVKYITTNYDGLIETQILKGIPSTSFSIGYPIHRQSKGVHVYHVHGSIKYPKKMVVTADDYFRFINSPDYFSHKVETLFQENSVVIIGYSLGDINFKSILNKHRSNRHHDINRQHLFYLSRSPVDQHIKDYYDRVYGLRVIDNLGIDEFFQCLEDTYNVVKPDVNLFKDFLYPVINGDASLTDSYLKKNDSFFEIIAMLTANGIIVSHPTVVEFLADVLERKRVLTTANGAWGQYVHLAGWLIHIGSIMDIKDTPLEETYLNAVKRSFNTMSKGMVMGCSWHAFNKWKSGWYHLTYDNRVMVSKYMRNNGVDDDGLEVINQ